MNQLVFFRVPVLVFRKQMGDRHDKHNIQLKIKIPKLTSAQILEKKVGQAA